MAVSYYYYTGLSTTDLSYHKLSHHYTITIMELANGFSCTARSVLPKTAWLQSIIGGLLAPRSTLSSIRSWTY